MEILGMGPLEILLILVLMLIILGPDQLVKTLKTIQTLIAKFRSSELAKEFTRLRQLPSEIARQTGMEALSKEITEVPQEVSQALKTGLDVPDWNTMIGGSIDGRLNAGELPRPQPAEDEGDVPKKQAAAPYDLSAWTTPLAPPDFPESLSTPERELPSDTGDEETED